MNPQYTDLLRGFCQLQCDRRAFLTTFLDKKKISYEILRQGGIHILVHPGGRKKNLTDHYTKVLTAHYDRVEGTPGANDNSASIFHLLHHIETLRKADFPHNSMILFTDKEELVGEKTIFDQGAYHLGRYWKEIRRDNPLFIVFDMCGIGETLVWGRNDIKLRKENPEYHLKSGLIQSIDAIYSSLSDLLFRYSRQTDMAINSMFSDDLGFIMNNLPAVQFSLLPWKEAIQWKKNRSEKPACWRINHTREDTFSTLSESAFYTMEKFLRDFSRYQFPLPR
jgi:hypothetical protein